MTLDGDEIVTEAVDSRRSASPTPVAAEGGARRRRCPGGRRRRVAARTPSGSDLWLDEFQQEDALIAPLQLPAEMSVLVASDGTAPAPSERDGVVAARRPPRRGRVRSSPAAAS